MFPSTCSKSMTTAGWAARSCWAACATARDDPVEAETADMYEIAVERLEALGIRRYEISNFARPGFESLHNLKYWRLEPYVGFGADAHSFDGRSAGRTRNRRRSMSSIAPRAETVAGQPGEEKFFVGLRLMDGIRPEPRRVAALRQPRSAGSWTRDCSKPSGDMLRLTSRGVMLSNEVFQEFLDIMIDRSAQRHRNQADAGDAPRHGRGRSRRRRLRRRSHREPPGAPRRRDPRQRSRAVSCPPAPWATPSA